MTHAIPVFFQLDCAIPGQGVLSRRLAVRPGPAYKRIGNRVIGRAHETVADGQPRVRPGVAAADPIGSAPDPASTGNTGFRNPISGQVVGLSTVSLMCPFTRGTPLGKFGFKAHLSDRSLHQVRTEMSHRSAVPGPMA